MKSSINRYGQLVVEHGNFPKGYYSVINGIECDLSEANEVSLVLGFQSECFDSKDTDTFQSVFNFHEAINDYK